jgi:hypothetical protein
MFVSLYSSITGPEKNWKTDNRFYVRSNPSVDDDQCLYCRQAILQIAPKGFPNYEPVGPRFLTIT